MTEAECTCTIGKKGACGHVAALLYTLADLKMRKKVTLPDDVACTSKAQSWHKPRGEKIKGQEVQSLEVVKFAKKKKPDIDATYDEQEFKAVKSTLYDPLRKQEFDFEHLKHNIEEAAPDFMILPALKQMEKIPKITTKFGPCAKGSVIATQQQLQVEYVVNIYDGVQYPALPCENNNRMVNMFAFVPSLKQLGILEDISVSLRKAHIFEAKTYSQSKSALWHKLRKYRITASTVGEIAKRRANYETLVTRLKSKKYICTAAMKHGIDEEPNAAIEYCKQHNNAVNVYPSGIILSPASPWIAASPDRKVYNPMRVPQFGLLEIKCPLKETIDEVMYLETNNGLRKLKKNHAYYYQVQTQLAVSGLFWCDFYVYIKKSNGTVEDFVEAIYFDPVFWKDTKEKLDHIYFHHYI